MPRHRHEVTVDSLAAQPPKHGQTKGEHILEALQATAQATPAGSLLPSERALADHFRVSRMTVRGAVDELASKGFATRVPGRGTFVKHPQLTHSETFRSFSDDMRLRGLEPGSLGYRSSTRGATQAIATALGVEPGSEILHIERVRTADGEPMALERTNVSLDRFPGLRAQMSADESLYGLIQRLYGIRLESARQRVSISRLSARDATKLAVAEGDPAFLVERTALDNMGRVVEFGRSLYRGDRYAIEMHVGAASSLTVS
ncbi:GntR family transcriptional regulator [Knoellia sp. CPCC 206453]|uniref:GntR family transcriptional regulator n=1 Tax=Knoellia pratensis TaxID=3404796 RepID=UPI00360EA3CC